MLWLNQKQSLCMITMISSVFFCASRVQSNQAGLQKELSEKSKLCKSLERQLKSTQEKLEYANQQLFGDRRQKVKPKTAKGESKKITLATSQC